MLKQVVRVATVIEDYHLKGCVKNTPLPQGKGTFPAILCLK